MSAAEIHARPMGPADVGPVIEMFEESFGRRITPAHYLWKLRTRESPVDNVTIAVTRDERPVFHLGGIPCRCRINGRERWAMVVVDSMTRPSYRRRGLLTQYTAEIFGRWREAGIAVVLGLPNEQWGSRTRALGWKPLFPLSWLVLPLAPQRILARRMKAPFIERLGFLRAAWNRKWKRIPATPEVTVEETGLSGDGLEDIWEEAGAGVTNGLVRDGAWIGWRYLSPPDGAYQVLIARKGGRPAGYAAYRVRERGQARSATLGDVFVRPGDLVSFRTLVRAVLARLETQQVDVVKALGVPGSSFYEQMNRVGFLRSRHSFGVEHVILDPALLGHDLANPAEWHLTGGDFDVD